MITRMNRRVQTAVYFDRETAYASRWLKSGKSFASRAGTHVFMSRREKPEDIDNSVAKTSSCTSWHYLTIAGISLDIERVLASEELKSPSSWEDSICLRRICTISKTTLETSVSSPQKTLRVGTSFLCRNLSQNSPPIRHELDLAVLLKGEPEHHMVYVT